jgi:3'-5' exoribonuclease
VNADDFCARTELDVEKMWECTLDILSKVEDCWYVELLNKFVKDEDWVREFKQHAAAVKVHHAFIGGLLQHTLFVMRLCVSYAKIYHLDYDLLITAAFLHDVGKLNEINEFPVNDYSEIGQMIGHVSEGAFIVRQACSEIEGFPEYKVNNLVHCILSHHGQLEFGSPKVPCIAEAIALHFADNTDSKLEIALEDGGKTDQWNRFLGTYVLPTERGE